MQSMEKIKFLKTSDSLINEFEHQTKKTTLSKHSTQTSNLNVLNLNSRLRQLAFFFLVKAEGGHLADGLSYSEFSLP